MYNLLPKPPYNAKQCKHYLGETCRAYKSILFGVGLQHSPKQMPYYNREQGNSNILGLILYLCYLPHINVLTSQNDSIDKRPM